MRRAIGLFNVDKQFYLSLSEQTGFHKDVIEKVHRLISILEYINTNAFLRERLVLKGGTALNLTIFNLPRLSVDIDLDFHSYADRNTVLQEREEVRRLLISYLEREGYRILPKSKSYFALESIVAGFANNAGNHDNIKIEVNYILRHHVFPIVKRRIYTEVFGETGEMSTIDGIELLAAKTAALYNRLAARDFYDLYNVSRYGILSNEQYNIYCHCVVFYRTLTSDTGKLDFSPKIVDKLQERTVAQDLYPMLVKRVDFDLASAKTQVKSFLAESIVITPSLQQYIDSFYAQNYRPELLFSGEMLERIKEHPMAIWKISKTGSK
jgi:predicted nucleotidyltransferase component of viral defense system